jgi:hypothetical protein
MFRIHSTDDGHELPFEYLPCSAMTPKYGMAMYITGGKLAKASGSNLATHICCREEESAVAAGTIIPVVTIQKNQIWNTEAQENSYAVGMAVDVHTDGLTVKAASSNGADNFVLDYVDGTDVRGHFVK